MASFEIILAAATSEAGPSIEHARTTDGDLLDVIVDGERVSAASEPEQAACLLRDLVSATVSVLEGRVRKVLVPLCDAPWELCLVGRGATLAMSLYRTGPVPEVRLLDRPIAVADFASQAQLALAAMAPRCSERFAAEIQSLLVRLDHASREPVALPAPEPDHLVRWRSRPESRRGDIRPVRFAFEAIVGSGPASDGEAVRADLHALLFRGRVSFEIRERRGELSPGFVFLQIERLLSLCRPLLDAWIARRALHLRVNAGETMLGLRLSSDGRLALTLSREGKTTSTAPGLDPRDFVEPVVDAAIALAQGAVRCDRTRSRNLRLRVLRSEARALRSLVHSLSKIGNKLNDDPETYRVSAVPPSPSCDTAGGLDLADAARLRYQQRWRAEIEGIDLRGTLLCGDRVIVPGVRETIAIDRRNGNVLWSRPLPRAATTLAGGGLLRLTSRGEVELRDTSDAEVIWASHIAPRTGGPALAFAVNATGLPRLVILAEGERRLVALDLRTGEPRWRHAVRHGGTFRIRRIGKLLVVSAGDRTLSALDVGTGEVVWRYLAAAPIQLTPTVHRDLVAVAAGVPARGAVRLVAIDAFTGAERWSVEHTGTAASVAVGSRNVIALAVNERDGVKLHAHDTQSGETCFERPLSGSALPGGTLALSAFDELMVANLPTGRVFGIDADCKEIRWTRALPAPLGDDVPRRMDAQLRAGALFVPQSSLAVLRPRDGSVIANVDACDLVPDLVRIDEACALYVAEESGHIACFELGTRMALVR